MRPTIISKSFAYRSTSGGGTGSSVGNSGHFSSLEVPSISMSEFEEIIVRCAFHAWDISGAGLNSKPIPNNFYNQESPKSSSNTSPTGSSTSAKSQQDFAAPTVGVGEIIDKYCKESASVISAKAVSSRLSWGINFLKPFLIVVKDFGQFAKVQSKDSAGSTPVQSNSISAVSSKSNIAISNKSSDSINSRVSKLSEKKVADSSSSNPRSINILESHSQMRKNDLISIASTSSGDGGGDTKLRLSHHPLQLIASSDSASSCLARSDDLMTDVYQQRLSYSFKDPVLRSSTGLNDDAQALSSQFVIGNNSNISNINSNKRKQWERFHVKC